jgi:hypothetical protein
MPSFVPQKKHIRIFFTQNLMSANSRRAAQKSRFIQRSGHSIQLQPFTAPSFHPSIIQIPNHSSDGLQSPLPDHLIA